MVLKSILIIFDMYLIDMYLRQLEYEGFYKAILSERYKY